MYNRLSPEAKQLLPTFFADRWSPVLRLTGGPTDPDAALTAIQQLYPLAKDTRYKHSQLLQYDAAHAGYHWVPTKDAPTQTRIPNRRERCIHKAQTSSMHSPQK